MKKTLISLAEAKALIETGKPLLVAGAEPLLKSLPRGNWAGGTTPYFMTEEGGKQSAEQLFVTQLPDFCKEGSVKLYGADELARIPEDCPAHGVSFIVMPSGSELLKTYAHQCATWPGLFDHPLLGWIAGVDLKDLAHATPKVFNGQTGAFSDNKAVLLHVPLPTSVSAKVSIINLFEKSDGAAITFPQSGFETETCFVDGVKRNFAEYLSEVKADSRWPLVASYTGAMINVSFQNVDLNARKVVFYAPVFEGMEYRLAKPQTDYTTRFERELSSRDVAPVFTCNCILNYLYAELEGKSTGKAVGPITFGEVAWMLLNQTMVYLTLTESTAG